MSILNKVQEETYFNFEILNPANNKIELSESLDYYGSCILTKQEFQQFINELQELHDKMEN